MFRKIFGYVMGLLKKGNLIPQSKQTETSIFTKEELEVLLRIIAEGNFKGKEIQVVYDMVYKLQQMYIENKE